MQGNAHLRTRRHHFPIPLWPCVGIVRVFAAIVLDHGSGGLEILPAGGVRLVLDAETLARFGETGINASGRT
jgi:hypothetical protein